MKKSVKILLAVALALVLTVSVICVSIFADSSTETPNLQITACTLSFDDSVYVMYALPIDSAAGAEVKMLYFTEAQDTLDEYNYANAKYRESHIGVQNAMGKDSYVYKNKHLNAKNMTDVVYARAYAKVGDVEYYSNLVKYSILEYAFNTLGRIPEANPSAAQLKLKELLETMLAYGAASQKYFNYNLENLATDEYFKISVVGGVMADACTKGMYKDEAELTITAPLINSEGASFAGWRDSTGAKVSTDAEYIVTVDGKNETYTAEYVKYSVGLEFEADEEGTCYLVGMGDCEDTDVVIPEKSPDGDLVVGIDSSAFAGEPITSVSIPASVVEIGRRAFNGCDQLTDVYYDGSRAQWEDISISSGNAPLEDATFHFAVLTYTVTFVDYDGTELAKIENVAYGASVTAPEAPTRDGYNFVGWDVDFSNVTSDLTVTAQYEEFVGDTYTVTFVDYNESIVLGTDTVVSGGTANLPDNPTRSGYIFAGWQGVYENVTSNQTVQAQYISEDASNIFLIDSATVSVGETFTVEVNLTGTVKLLTFDMCLYYDASVLEVVSYDDQEVTINHFADEGMFVLNHSQDKNRTKDKYLTEITFRVKAGAMASSTEIYISDAKDIVYVNDGGTYSDADYELIAGVVRIQ